WAMKPNAVRNDVPISITDWYLWSNFTYGKSGARYILNTLAANGVRNIWVRTIGGVAHGYRPQVDGATQWQPNGAQGEDVRNYDFLQDAVEYGHKLGMKVYGWFIPLEEYHGNQNWDRSFITDNRADLWDQVYSSQYVVTKGDCPSFYYSEYRDYKISLINDIIKRYDIDGVVLDFERCSFRNNKWGYLQQMRQAFQNETGINPWSISTENTEWLAFRARYVGEVVETVRRIIDGSARAMDLIAWYPWETPLTAHYDIMKWSQEGLLDTIGVYKHGTEGWGSPGYPTEGLYSTLSSQLNKPILFGVYTAVTGEANVQSCADSALSQGFNGIVWFEATPLIGRGYQDLPRNLSARGSLVIRSCNFDLTNGGEIFVISAGSWALGIDNLQQPIAAGAGGLVSKVVLPPLSGSHSLIISTSLDATCPAGVAIQGYTLNGENQRIIIKTDTNWTNLSSSEPLLRFGQPGIYPFLGE
ncbi:MAG: family 10 glycosylhydrolase, partial [Phycisphaerales bacterium]